MRDNATLPPEVNLDSLFHMQFALSTVIKNAKCRVAALLNFSNDESRANSVNCAGWNEKAVTRKNSLPDHEIHNRAVVDGFAQLL